MHNIICFNHSYWLLIPEDITFNWKNLSNHKFDGHYHIRMILFYLITISWQARPNRTNHPRLLFTQSSLSTGNIYISSLLIHSKSPSNSTRQIQDPPHFSITIKIEKSSFLQLNHKLWQLSYLFRYTKDK